MRRKHAIRWLCLAVIMSLCLSMPAFAAVEDTGFSDVAADAWYADAVQYVSDTGIMNGTDTTIFSPEDTMTRAMLAAALYRAAGSPAVTGTDRFSDTVDGAYYANAVVWASENGIVSGYDNGLFGVNDPVSREQIATLLWRYNGSNTGSASASFTDSAAISSYAVEAVNWAVENGIVTGFFDGSFGPKESVTRAQVAVMLYRYLTNTPQIPDETPDADGSILIAYFSRAGENWEVGNIEKGNTQIIAEMIAAQTGGELFHIQTAEPYPEDYMETVRQAQTERETGARPELAANVENWDNYDTIFLGYPIWGGDMPMAVYTFIESHDWTGKTIVPFNTHGGSGQSGTVSSIRSACTGATVHSGIAISGVTAQNDRESARSTVTAWLEGEGLAISDNAAQADYDFSVFTNVEITGVNISALGDEELSVLYRQARYSQAMTEADTDTMAELVAEDVMFTHMSGMRQTRTEYFADIENGSLRYFTIGIENPIIEVSGNSASITYTSVLNANAYGASGTYRMSGTHRLENIDGQWMSVNR